MHNFALCTCVCSNFDTCAYGCAILNSQVPKIFCFYNNVNFLGNSEVAFFLYTLYTRPSRSGEYFSGRWTGRGIREFGNLERQRKKKIVAYIVVFEPKYTLLHLVCLFKCSCFSQTTLK
jgi:hypothetical protein